MAKEHEDYADELRKAIEDARARRERAEELGERVRLLQEAYPPGPWTPRYPSLDNSPPRNA
jgi:hypothetical protein